jgi:hypothetical protein
MRRESLQRVAAKCLSHRLQSTAMALIDRPHVGWWLAIIGGMTTLAVTAFSSAAFAWWTVHLFWLPPRPVLVWTFVAAVVLHVGEAAYAYGLARSAIAPAAALGWTLQTLALGYPSLRLLRRRTRGAGASSDDGE